MIARKQKNSLKGFNNKKFEILISNANKCDNPLAGLVTGDYNIDDQKFEVTCSRSSNLGEDTMNWVMQLTEANMSELYEQSEWGWNAANKRKELTHSTAYILLVKDQLNDRHCAFAHFRFEFDNNNFKGVIYCYELQIAQGYQRKGIGSLLMKLIRQVGAQFKMSRVMLTCFGYNQAAMDFYIKKLGYHVDKSSPSRCAEGKTFYEILSLKID